MTRGKLLEILASCAGDYYYHALKSIERDNHMNDLSRNDFKTIKKMPNFSQKLVEAAIVDFINYIGIEFCLDYGLYTKHLPEEREKNEKRKK